MDKEPEPLKLRSGTAHRYGYPSTNHGSRAIADLASSVGLALILLLRHAVAG
jgi:hypothetical protein